MFFSGCRRQINHFTSKLSSMVGPVMNVAAKGDEWDSLNGMKMRRRDTCGQFTEIVPTTTRFRSEVNTATLLLRPNGGGRKSGSISILQVSGDDLL